MKRWFSALAFALLGITCAAAQPYPSRPITLVVPLGVGGSTDVIGRLMGEGMRQHLGQPIVVENTTGAGGTIGVGRVARAAPDGYTFLIGQWGTNVASGAIYPLQFDLEKDFEPISLIATQPFLIERACHDHALRFEWDRLGGDCRSSGGAEASRLDPRPRVRV